MPWLAPVVLAAPVYLVASILWQEETPDNPLPANLIKGSKKLRRTR